MKNTKGTIFLAGFLSVASSGMLFSRTTQAHSHDDTPEALRAHFYRCEDTMDHLPSTTDLDTLTDCMNFYWHHEGLDRPAGSYNKYLQLSYRYVEVDPHDIQVYADTAWLLLSKWETWTLDPQKMPDGAGCDKMALEFILKGELDNPKDPEFYLQAGLTFYKFARDDHRPDYLGYALRTLKLSDRYAQDSHRQTQTRSLIARLYEEQGQWAEASAWNNMALQIEPNSTAALGMQADIAAQKISN